MKFAIVQISGRQYKVNEGKSLLVDFLGDIKTFEADKILLIADDDGVKIGKPYLTDKLMFNVETIKKDKIRVATYHAKANYRRVKGIRPLKSKLTLN